MKRPDSEIPCKYEMRANYKLTQRKTNSDHELEIRFAKMFFGIERIFWKLRPSAEFQTFGGSGTGQLGYGPRWSLKQSRFLFLEPGRKFERRSGRIREICRGIIFCNSARPSMARRDRIVIAYALSRRSEAATSTLSLPSRKTSPA